MEWLHCRWFFSDAVVVDVAYDDQGIFYIDENEQPVREYTAYFIAKEKSFLELNLVGESSRKEVLITVSGKRYNSSPLNRVRVSTMDC